MKLHINIRAERVLLGPMELQGQWVDFYVLLALARSGTPDRDAFVTAAQVARVGPWRHKAPGSVGKEVARHLAALDRHGIGGAVRCQGRTRSWHLDLPPRALVFDPDRPAVEAWIKARSRHADPTGDGLGHLHALIDAMAALQRGDAGATLDRLAPFLDTRAPPGLEPALDAWTALLCGRAYSQHEDEEDDLLSRLHDAWIARTDATGRAVGVRLRACLALRYRFVDPAATMASFAKLAADLELRGDIGSLGVVVNVMGLLARRAADPTTGADHHLRAAALFGVGGDYPSLQAALFNLAICRRDTLEQQGRLPDEGVLDALEMCRLVCATFGVGRDSAQAEIAGAQWAHEMGDTARARRYLAEAEGLLRTIESTYDHAYFLEVRARIDHADSGGAGDPARDLRTARRLFARVGDARGVARVRGLLKAWFDGGGDAGEPAATPRRRRRR